MRIGLGLVIVLVFLGHAARFYQVGLITQLDNIIYDYRLRLTMPDTVDDRIVILDIDEKSLAVPELGRWPWNRRTMAELVRKLFDEYGIALLGFDVVFAEPDYSSGIRALDGLAQKELKDNGGFQSTYEKLRPQLDYDGQFGLALKGRPVVFGYYFNSEEDARESGVLPEPVLPEGTFSGRAIGFTTWRVAVGAGVGLVGEGEGAEVGEAGVGLTLAVGLGDGSEVGEPTVITVLVRTTGVSPAPLGTLPSSSP